MAKSQTKRGIDISEDISILIAVLGVAISVTGFFIGRQTEARKTGIDKGVLQADVDYIKQRLDELLVEYKTITINIQSLTEQSIRNEASNKQAHRRIDDLLARLDQINLRIDELFSKFDKMGGK